MSLTSLKSLLVSSGLYRPARALHDLVWGDRNRKLHQKLLAEFVRSGDLVFDVGANIGDRSSAMAALGANVVAFEPQPSCVQEIRARCGKQVTVVATAVGSVAGEAKLYLAPSSPLASLKPGWESVRAVGTLTVPVITLDQAIAKYGIPTFCKIDVEGFESEVLRGLNTPVRSLSFEYHFTEDGHKAVAECIDLISRLGRYEFNLVGSNNATWLSSWSDKTHFLSSFRETAKSHYYGDIFARRVSAS
jgi:FkbM family methyltransferase